MPIGRAMSPRSMVANDAWRSASLRRHAAARMLNAGLRWLLQTLLTIGDPVNGLSEAWK